MDRPAVGSLAMSFPAEPASTKPMSKLALDAVVFGARNHAPHLALEEESAFSSGPGARMTVWFDNYPGPIIEACIINKYVKSLLPEFTHTAFVVREQPNTTHTVYSL